MYFDLILLVLQLTIYQTIGHSYLRKEERVTSQQYAFKYFKIYLHPSTDIIIDNINA